MSTVETTVTLFAGRSLATSGASPVIDTKQYLTGMIVSAWAGNDALDATLTLQGSADRTHWGNVGIMMDDVGSVTLDSAGDPDNDSQQWAFTENFPFRYLRMVYAAGANTTGTLDLHFTGYSQGSQ